MPPVRDSVASLRFMFLAPRFRSSFVCFHEVLFCNTIAVYTLPTFVIQAYLCAWTCFRPFWNDQCFACGCSAAVYRFCLRCFPLWADACEHAACVSCSIARTCFCVEISNWKGASKETNVSGRDRENWQGVSGEVCVWFCVTFFGKRFYIGSR